MANKNIETGGSSSLESDTQAEPISSSPRKLTFKEKLRHKLASINIYFLVFLLILVIVLILTFFLWRSANQQDADNNTFQLENLSQEALDEINNKDSAIGSPQQTLTVSSNSVFDGRVLVRDSLDVAGTINVGGALSLPGITVSGTSSFEEVEVSNNLLVAGNTSVQGSLNIQQDLTVSGDTNFNGNLSVASLTVDDLNLNGDLSFSRHIDAGGGLPSASAGNSIGSGGTVSVNGSDTAGSVTINTGSSPSTGALAQVSFNANFNQTPHIAIAPVSQAAAQANVFITRTTSGFTISASSAPAANSTLIFDFIAIE